MGYSPWGHKELDTTERLHFTGELDVAHTESSHAVIRSKIWSAATKTQCSHRDYEKKRPQPTLTVSLQPASLAELQCGPLSARHLMGPQSQLAAPSDLLPP